jgi:hypothetical protein
MAHIVDVFLFFFVAVLAGNIESNNDVTRERIIPSWSTGTCKKESVAGQVFWSRDRLN